MEVQAGRLKEARERSLYEDQEGTLVAHSGRLEKTQEGYKRMKRGV